MPLRSIFYVFDQDGFHAEENIPMRGAAGDELPAIATHRVIQQQFEVCEDDTPAEIVNAFIQFIAQLHYDHEQGCFFLVGQV